MKKVKRINFAMSRWWYSSVFQNTFSTIVVTALITSIITRHYKTVFDVIKNKYFILFEIIILALYYICSREKIIKKVKINEDNLKKEWVNNELRPNIDTNGFVSDKALHVQFMDIPFTLKTVLPDKYALEFRAKVLNYCFAWCVNASVQNKEMQGYMFQYTPLTKRLRPHFLVGYDEGKATPLWLQPVSKMSPQAPLMSINDLVLRNKDGWYFVRTEVARYKNVKKNIDSAYLKNISQLYNEQQGEKITYNEERQNEVVEIRIYDMNDLGKEIYHTFFNEPPLKCFVGGTIGFRNCNFESALYKDIVLTRV
jgi:hypothetical protein